MTEGAAGERPYELTARWRDWCLVGAALVAIACLLPPLSGAARRYEYGEALQFSLFAIAIPLLVAIGAPWRHLGLARASDVETPRLVDRIADRRLRHRELPWSLAFIAADLGAVVAWHAPGAVAAVSQHGWLCRREAVTLLGFRPGPLARARGLAASGAALGLPAQGGPGRIGHVDVLDPRLRHSDCPTMPSTRTSPMFRVSLSAAADQQVASAILWFVAAASFAPVIFWNALLWLRTDEDPDAELLALERAERRRGTPPPTGR